MNPGLAGENITHSQRGNVENVCIPSRKQAKLAADSKIDSPKSYSFHMQARRYNGSLENNESMSDNLVKQIFIQCADS